MRDDYTPTGYEKGSPAWDIGQMLTRHRTLPTAVCARVVELRRSAHAGETPAARLDRALKTVCDCGAGNSDSEATSLRG